MTEVKKIKNSLAKEGNRAFENGKNSSGAYVMRGNSIVKVTSNGSIEVVERTSQAKVKVKEADRVVVLK